MLELKYVNNFNYFIFNKAAQKALKAGYPDGSLQGLDVFEARAVGDSEAFIYQIEPLRRQTKCQKN